jgi:hypothetical protein
MGRINRKIFIQKAAILGGMIIAAKTNLSFSNITGKGRDSEKLIPILSLSILYICILFIPRFM